MSAILVLISTKNTTCSQCFKLCTGKAATSIIILQTSLTNTVYTLPGHHCIDPFLRRCQACRPNETFQNSKRVEWQWNKRIEYKVIRLSIHSFTRTAQSFARTVHSFAHTAHSFACSVMLASLLHSAALIHSPAHSWTVGQNQVVLRHLIIHIP